MQTDTNDLILLNLLLFRSKKIERNYQMNLMIARMQMKTKTRRACFFGRCCFEMQPTEIWLTKRWVALAVKAGGRPPPP